MNRPILDPTFVAVSPVPLPRRVWRAAALRYLRWCGRSLLSHPFRAHPSAAEQPTAAVGATLLGIACRLVLLPVLLVPAALAMVYGGTHPPAPPLVSDPGSQGLYYDPVNLAGADGTRLGGWLLPALDARRVLDQRDAVLRTRGPAIVLVHDFGQSPQQMLPFLGPLHDEGFVLLALGVRGVGVERGVAQTFGLRESFDVAAAVEMLRRRPFVDPSRIALLGLGSGANACVLVAERDPQIMALVLANPAGGASDALRRRIGPEQAWMHWMRPLCRWTFEVAYSVDADELEMAGRTRVTSAVPTLALNPTTDGGYVDAYAVDAVRTFFHAQLSKTDARVAAVR